MLKGVLEWDAFFLSIFRYEKIVLIRWKISLVVAVLLIVLGPAPSCMKKYEPVEEIDISLCSISSQLLDNSGKEPKNLSSDSVNAKAFAFYINQFYKELPSFCN